MRRGNLVLASLSAVVGIVTVAVAVVGGGGDILGLAVGVIFIANALVRWTIARRARDAASTGAPLERRSGEWEA